MLARTTNPKPDESLLGLPDRQYGERQQYLRTPCHCSVYCFILLVSVNQLSDLVENWQTLKLKLQIGFVEFLNKGRALDQINLGPEVLAY